MYVHLCASRLANHGSLQHIRAGWTYDERDSLPQNAVAVGCTEGRAPIHAVAGVTAGDGQVYLTYVQPLLTTMRNGIQ
jgi:hypothetical protein